MVSGRRGYASPYRTPGGNDGLTHEDRDFDTSAGHDKTDRYSARLDWRIGRALFLGIEGRKEDRSGSTVYSYDETIYMASISYQPGAP